MKVLVPVKRVVDANVKVRVKPDNTGVDLSNVKMAVNPFCEIAIEEAVRLKEAGVASEVVAVAVGGSACQEQLRTCLALGADRAVLVETDEPVHPLGVAKALKALQDSEQADIVLFGKQSIDGDNSQTGPMFAALTGLPQATFASEVKPQGRLAGSDAGSGWRAADHLREAARRHHHGPAAQRTPLRFAAQHHEGQAQADGQDDAGRARRRCRFQR